MAYADLQTDIADWLNRSTLTSTIPTFITLAESEIDRRLRTADTLAIGTGTTSSNPVDLSTDLTRFRQIKAIKIVYQGVDIVLNQVSMDILWSRYPGTSSGVPEYYALSGTDLYLDPAPNGEFAWSIQYYQGLNPLSATNTTNWLLDKHYDLYLVASQYQASMYLKHFEAAAGFKQLQENIISQIKDRDVRDMRGGTARMISEVQAV